MTVAEDKYKALYIDLLKKCAGDVDICEKCANKPNFKCGKACPQHIEGRGGYIDGRYVDFPWTCEDFDWGDCPRMETTPCRGCYNDNFCHFVLKEE